MLRNSFPAFHFPARIKHRCFLFLHLDLKSELIENLAGFFRFTELLDIIDLAFLSSPQYHL
jgi:hypothetical protein